MTVFLKGIAAQFYRGIGSEVQYICPLSSMNFFIGANNSGKSIVLGLIADRLQKIRPVSRSKPLEGPDIHRGRVTGQFMVATGMPTEELIEDLIAPHAGKYFRNYNDYKATLRSELGKIVQGVSVGGHVWKALQENGTPVLYPPVNFEQARSWTLEWESVWSTFTHQSGGSYNHWIPETLSLLAAVDSPPLPNIDLIPAKRKLGPKGAAYVDRSGEGVIDHLASLQRPDYDKWVEDTAKFEKINCFLQEVTGKPDARLDVPHNRDHLLVHMDNKVLPLSSLGTGIHEVILIAAFCTIHDGSIMCIEEPEIHLHPLLQRKLIRYLSENTTSQYFIATHSAAFIDTPGANIFRVTNDGEQTRISAVVTKNEQRAILDDLGYQASDILQANAVIWVEGPSDRIYLKHWIAAADAALVEGIHYTIMFYGGALIRHLTASDEALEDFIKLKDLNRNMAIVMDSDRASAGADLKPHVLRLQSEVSKEDGVVWVTAGREMENYIDGSKLQAALKKVHPTLYKAPGRTGQYDNSFYFFRDNPEKPQGGKVTYKDANKVAVAGVICTEVAQLDVLDLRERVNELVAMIRRANGLAREISCS